MKHNNGSVRYRLLTNGTDISYFSPPENSSGRKGILFSGKLDVWANVLMAENIVKNILPAIIKEIPGARLDIVGANPPKAILNLESDSVRIYANVPSVVPYLQNAELFLHPHTGGSGIQNKLLEAMACACPVVTTPTGIQGIPATNGKDVLIGANNSELASHALSLLRDKKLAANFGANARETIVSTHSWESVFETLDDIIYEIIE
jgi:glycosyltransferase involved in cell wall biosynthesis